MRQAEDPNASHYTCLIVRAGERPHGRTFRPTSEYADICWLAVLGPVALTTYRLLVTVASCDSGWVPMQRDELLALLGMVDLHDELDLAFDRLIAHSLVTRRGIEVTVRTRMPPVNDIVLGWLPAAARRYHDDATRERGI